MKNFILLLGVGALCILASCSSEDKEKQEVKYQVIRPFVTDTVYVNDHVAEINALQNVEIRARVSGIIERVHVDEGQTVHKDQTLFSINNQQFIQELHKAKAATKSVLAQLNSAEIELRGSTKLLDKDYISKPEYDLAAAKVEELRAILDGAQANEVQASLNLSFSQVKAPFDGIINRIPNREGSLVEQDALLTNISNNNEMYVYFNVSETDYLDYAESKREEKSKEVQLVLANGILYPYKGVIETAESEFDRSTGTIAFRAKFPNPERILKHGATGKIQTNTELQNAMLIPQKSTFDQQEHLFVYVVDSTGMVQVQKVIPSARLPHLFVVGSGLSPQDRIILEGIQGVKEGDIIIPETVSFYQVFNH